MSAGLALWPPSGCAEMSLLSEPFPNGPPAPCASCLPPHPVFLRRSQHHLSHGIFYGCIFFILCLTLQLEEERGTFACFFTVLYPAL